jgi:HEAT repeat protein
MNGLDALGSATSNALPQLIGIYDRHPNALSQQIVPWIISGLGPSSRAAVPMLVRATTNTNENVRLNALYALGKIHAERESTVVAIIKSLHDTSRNVQANATDALGAFRKDAKPAVPALLELLKREQTNPSSSQGGMGPPYRRVSVSPLMNFSWFGSSTNVDIITPVTAALKAIDPEAAAKAGIK